MRLVAEVVAAAGAGIGQSRCHWVGDLRVGDVGVSRQWPPIIVGRRSGCAELSSTR